MTRMDVPEHHRKLYDRAMTGRSSKAMIHCYCLMCCGWQLREVDLCTAPSCPLYAQRSPSARKVILPRTKQPTQTAKEMPCRFGRPWDSGQTEK
jgi:hypothetical protein